MPVHERVVAIALPWLVTVPFAAAYVRLILPRLADGGFGALIAVAAGTALACFALAAASLTTDIVRGRDIKA